MGNEHVDLTAAFIDRLLTTGEYWKHMNLGASYPFWHSNGYVYLFKNVDAIILDWVEQPMKLIKGGAKNTCVPETEHVVPFQSGPFGEWLNDNGIKFAHRSGPSTAYWTGWPIYDLGPMMRAAQEDGVPSLRKTREMEAIFDFE